MIDRVSQGDGRWAVGGVSRDTESLSRRTYRPATITTADSTQVYRVHQSQGLSRPVLIWDSKGKAVLPDKETRPCSGPKRFNHADCDRDRQMATAILIHRRRALELPRSAKCGAGAARGWARGASGFKA
jgi:hypothetical protein